MVDFRPVNRAMLDEEKLARVEAMCLCPTCPSYPGEDRGVKKAYCLRGDSAHKDRIEPTNCICESCEVYKHGKLYGSNYFCLTGAALAKGMRNLAQGDPITKLADAKAPRGAPVLFVSGGLDEHKRGD